jgi:PAS domain S-box-containing protein/putative nucleotidyltransferase with HDIG domain
MYRKCIELENLKSTGLKVARENFNGLKILETEEAIFNSNGNKKHRELAERLNEIIVEVNREGRIVYANKNAFEKTGYTKEEVDEGINIKQVIVPEERCKMVSNFSDLFKGKELSRSTYTIKRKDGSTFPVITYPDYILNSEGQIVGIRELLVDVTDFREAEEKIRESEERYRSLFENTLDGIYRTTFEGKYIDANPSLVKMLGYDCKKELLAIDIPTQLYIRREDRPAPNKRNKIFETQLKKKDGTIITVEINSRVIYRNGKPVYYEGIVRDITQRKITDEKLNESYQKLRKTLNDIINTLASIIETKDPYTSGHQKRVASLATSIAKEMGLDNDKIECIRIAALIHDIGKINLPTSILTRPGRLSEIEYDMIKTHAQLGHDMISRVEFPWPIADIILQHHERIDGSGYPGGLKGKHITPEAKILAVADVVEAMASHRPYRPSLGVNKALEEINRGRGKLYDAEVVDACTELIKSKKFNFSL